MGKLSVGGKTFNLTLAVGPSSGSAPVQEVTFSGSVTVIFDLMSGTNLQFVTRGDSPEAAYIDELATDVWLMGDVLNLRLRAWAVWQQWYQNGQDNVAVMAVTYKKLLQRRFFVTPLAFTNLDLGTILWGMWQHTQAQPGGNLGVTLGANSTGLSRTRGYKVGENLGAQAEAEYEEGVWWDVDQNKVFTAGATSAGLWLDTPLHLGVNITEMNRASGSDFANAVYGDADESATTGVWAVAADVATDPRGRWELVSGWPTVTLQQTVNDRTAAFLVASRIPVAHWNLDIEPSRWLGDSKLMPGMFAVLVIPTSLAAPLGAPADKIVVFVSQLSVNFDEDGSLTVKVVVNERPDIPIPSYGTDSSARVGVARVGHARVGVS